jgi:uncharacterized protein YjdB
MQTPLSSIKNRLTTNAVFPFVFLCLFFTGNAFATDWYVALPPLGNNANDGQSASTPFATIQKASDVAVAGDVVNVLAGEYREQVDVKSGVTFSAAPGTVTLNGTELLTGWSPEAGSTYKTAMNWDVDALYGSNQLFQGKKMIELLRWPKQTSPDIILPTNAKAESVVKSGATYITLTDAEFTEGDGRWVGAKIWINLSRHGHDGQGWTGDVVATSGNTITVDWRGTDPRFGDQPWGFGPDQEYFLYDPTPQGVAVAGIDNMLGEGEWWKNNETKMLYVKTRGGQAPAATGANLVEAKKRHFGFWSSTDTKHSYTIRGFNFFACSFTTVPNAKLYVATEVSQGKQRFAQQVTNVLLEDLDFTYPSHQTEMRGNWQLEFAGYTGVVFNGVNSTIQNCKIRYTATSALSIQGENLKVLNNEIESTNVLCANSGTINCGWWVRDSQIGHNKIWNTSHMAIQLHGALNSNINNRYQMRVHHNRIWDFLRRSDDSGAIDHSFVDGQWMRIDHNTIFQSGIDEAIDVYRFQKSAIYMDYGQLNPEPTMTGHLTIDHNVMYNVQNAILLNEINEVNILNNVMLIDEWKGKKTTIEGHSGETREGFSSFGKGVKIVNNIMSHPPNRDPYDPFSQFKLVEYHNNILSANKASTLLDSLFVDARNPDLRLRNYALKASAPAIDKGVRMGIYNDDAIEEPDLGAFEGGADGNNSANDATPPAQPAEPTLGNTLELSFSLTWPATPDVGGGVAYYELSTEPGTPELTTRYTDVPNMTVKGITNATEYTFNLVAVDGMGNRSQPRQFNVTSSDQVADLRLPKTTAAPALDGIREAAVYTLPQVPISVLGEGVLALNDDDFSAHWTATWDDTHLYVHVAVNDNIRRVDSEAWYGDDNVELFLNGNGTRPGTWGATDFHFLVRPAATSTGTIEQFRNFAIRPVPAGVESFTRTVPGTNNYTVEVKIPFSVLGFTERPQAQFIGMEVNVGDDDGLNGTTTSRKMVWRNMAYRRPADFGLVQLGGLAATDRTDPVGSGIVTARGEGPKTKPTGTKENAFDNNPDSNWTDVQATSWIQFRFNGTGYNGVEKYAVSSYTVTSAAGDRKAPASDPKNWTLYGTNAVNPTFPGDYVAVDTRSNIVFSTRKEKQTFTAANKTEYRAYRLQITANNGSKETRVGEIELFAPPQIVPVNAVAVTPASDTLEVGESRTLTVTVSPETANQRVLWGSSNPKVATVDVNGLVTAVGVGTANITVTSRQDTTKKAVAAIKVVPVYLVDRTDPVGAGTVRSRGEQLPNEPATNAFDNTNKKWFHGATQSWVQYTFSGTEKYAVSKYTLTSANDVPERDPKDWKLYGTNVANPVFPADFVEVDSRTGIAFAGRSEKQAFTIPNTTEYRTYRLDITANNGAPQIQVAEIELFAPPSTSVVPGVAVTPSAAYIVIGEGQLLKSLVTPAASDQTVTWSSSNSGVAAVNGSGMVTGLATGTAVITATSVADTTLKATATIAVQPPSARLFDRTDPVGSGVILAKGEQAPNEGKAQAFDNNNGTKWFHGATQSWIQFKFSNDGSIRYAVVKYTLTSANDVSERDPRDWKLYGTNVANPVFPGDFVEIDSRTGVTFQSRFQKQEFFTVGNTTEYGTYRLDITANSGAPQIQLAEIELFAPASSTVVTSVAVTPASDTVEVGAQVSLTASASPANASQAVNWSSSDPNVATVNGSGVVTGVAVGTATITAKSGQDSTKTAAATIAVQPVSSVDRTDPVGSGVVSASGENPGEPARNAFDNNPNTKWFVNYFQSWIQFKFTDDGSAKYAVSKYTITSANDVPERDPRDWKLYGTNAANPVFPADFVEIDSRTGVTFPSRFQKQAFTTGNTTEYSTYRLQITANSGAFPTQLAEIELFAPAASAGAGSGAQAARAGTARSGPLESLALEVYPNPASREVNISLKGFEGESAVQVKLTDAAGNAHVSKQVRLGAGVNQVTLPVSHLPQGLFVVRVQGSKTAKTAKLSIAK